MISKYLESLQTVFTNMKAGREFTFVDYLTSIGLSVGLVLMVLAILFAIVIMCVGPKKAYDKMVAELKANRDALISSGKMLSADLDAINKKIRNRTGLFVLGIVAIYIPIVVPTVLYLCYLVFHV